MKSYLILSRFAATAFREPNQIEILSARVRAEIGRQCQGLEWKGSYATLGRYDVVDLIECDDPMTVQRAAMIIRAYGHCTTETLLARPWQEFLDRL